ncbi:MAG: hypothetical protein ACYC97_13425 [Metallibacterium sp.]
MQGIARAGRFLPDKLAAPGFVPRRRFFLGRQRMRYFERYMAAFFSAVIALLLIPIFLGTAVMCKVLWLLLIGLPR